MKLGIFFLLAVGPWLFSMVECCQEGDVRLRDGTTVEEGRVEVCVSGEWGTVCDDSWSDLDASVVCQQLNYSRFHAVAFNSAHYGEGNGTIHFSNINCFGNESSLVNCSFSSQHNCNHSKDAGVQCKSELFCNDSAIRLIGGSDQFEGRVEVCFNETWGTVCDGSWSTDDAAVTCRQLGFSIRGATAYRNSFFGQGIGPVYFDNFACRGAESLLVECDSGRFISFECTQHNNDAGIRCGENCNSGDVRLVDGGSFNEGRVEICRIEQWGTICDNSWEDSDASVVCAQLGFSTIGAQAFSFAFFGEGTAPILLDNVQCQGTENGLLDCLFDTLNSCEHSEDAGVSCQGCANNQIRLVGGTEPSEGRVEICQNSTWGTVCDNSWDNSDAMVVCRQLGFSVIGATSLAQAFFGQGTGMIYLDNIACTGSETRLSDCTATTTHNCAHSEDAGVTCIPILHCTNGEARLVGGADELEGRVEVCIDETWGTVCDDGWDTRDTAVVCRQLGYSKFNSVAHSNAVFGHGTGPIYADNVGCIGTEFRLLDCHYDLHTVDCSPAENAGLRCNDTLFCVNGQLRLVSGTTKLDGRLEICYNETWGTICDNFWSVEDANVACKQLGFQPNGAIAVTNAGFGMGTGPIWLDDLICFGMEAELINCIHGGVGAVDFCNGHADDAGLICLEGCVNNQVRLVDGAVPSQGRVEVCLDQQWGTVCDDDWDTTDVNILCKQLGYSRFNASIQSYDLGTGPIHLNVVRCTGTEDNFLQCQFLSDTSNCTHSQDVGVVCDPELVCNNGDVRLVGGTVMTEGRVEICINETWGTVCDDQWDANDAGVACRSVGLSRFGASPLVRVSFSDASGPIFLDDIQCSGDEDGLLDCPNRMLNNCTHSDDVGVRCSDLFPICQDGDIRLVNGPTSVNSSGRVDVCRNEVWGTVCDDAWSQVDANVACRQLGYSRYDAVVRDNAFYGMGAGQISLATVSCEGRENRLFDCPFSTNIICTHSQDVGVVCSTERRCNDGDIRLQNGQTQFEGRVELCIDEVWSTICDNRWSIDDANVACRQAGHLGQEAVPYGLARFGQGTGPVVLNNLLCSGSESSLLNCRSDGLGNIGTCTHADDAGVVCMEACVTDDIRLVSGSSEYEGRVEICREHVWGTVCDDFWEDIDASVLCRQFGYSDENAIAVLFSGFGPGVGPIYLNDVDCRGQETSLLNCAHSTTVSDCNHMEDAGVRCQPCTNGEIRLEDGSDIYRGRVEVCRDQDWGTVCDVSWTVTEATVVCRHLGYSGFFAQAFSGAFFGPGSGAILLSDVNCTGNETNVYDCSSETQFNCTHSQDAGVQCNPSPVCVENSLRLLDGPNVAAGRVEVCVLETWRTICDNQWGPEDASVVCKQLGFSRFNANATRNSSFGVGSGPIWADSVTCMGQEDRIVDCSTNSVSSSCSHTTDAGVECSEALLCINGDLRLVNGPTIQAGRLEICWNETWGTVCDNGWLQQDAVIACRQLGLNTRIVQPTYSATFGHGTGPIILNNIQCTGNELQLIDCLHDGVGMSGTCVHADDAGVICQESCDDGAIRLSAGQVPYEGRVEVCVNETWGTVCDDLWNKQDASVACRQAGYSRFNVAVFGQAHFGVGIGPIHLNNLRCTGNEASILDCRSTIPDCSHEEDAGVRCDPTLVCEEGGLRLRNGTSALEGRVEICVNEAWGTVCDLLWSTNDGTVACRQLGHSIFGARTVLGPFFERGSGPITIGDVQCSGTELRLFDCPNGGIGGYMGRCTHRNDAGVICQPKGCDDGSVRLVDGTTPLEGRVEMCFNEAWGTICDNDFDVADATVICRQLGYSIQGSLAVMGAGFGQGTGVTLIDSLQCIGNETTLFDCPFVPIDNIGSLNCPHTRDSGVICQIRPSFPSNVSVTANSNTSVILSWEEPQEYYSTLSNYRITCDSISAMNMPTVVDTQTFTYILPNLTPFRNYTCCVESVYTDLTENATVCSSGRTMEGVPGPPTNVQAVPSSTNCSQVLLTWDLPPEDERNGIIREYRMLVIAQDNSRFEEFYTSPTNSYTADQLSCCTSFTYQVQVSTVVYGPTTLPHPFRTLPDLRDPIVVTTEASNSTAISIVWITPQSVLDQGLTQYRVVVTSKCVSGVEVSPPRRLSIGVHERPIVTISELAPFIPYQICVTAVICESTVEIFNETKYTVQPTLSSPVITNSTRIGPDSAFVQFEVSAGEGNVDFYETTYYVDGGNASTTRTEVKEITLRNLATCSAYTIVVTALSCGSRTTSQPQILELYETSMFQFDISLQENVLCRTWITLNFEEKISDVEGTITSVLELPPCNRNADCFSNSTFACITNDQNTVTFQTTLVSSVQSSSDDQLTCLDEWTIGVGTITVQGTTHQVLGNTVTTAVSEPTEESGLQSWLWVIIAVLPLGILVVAVLTFIVLQCRRQKNSTSRTAYDDDPYYEPFSIPKEFQDKQQLVTQNPLYEEDFPQYDMMGYVHEKEFEHVVENELWHMNQDDDISEQFWDMDQDDDTIPLTVLN